jgi:psiF repeat-containing protein
MTSILSEEGTHENGASNGGSSVARSGKTLDRGDAGARALKGDERKAFMSGYLKGEKKM